ncbi:MAG: CheR family methyltransferase [bacterium]
MFRKLCDLAYREAGIALGDGKQSLVSARVSKRIRTLGLAGPADYLRYLEHPDHAEEIVSFLDAISTNFTFFFREEDHFQVLSEELKRLVAQGQRRFRIWCAASSTGEEPYSLAITLLEAVSGVDADVRILATDISTRVLEIASEGRYPAAAVVKIPPRLLHRYFTREGRGGEETFRVESPLRDIVTFKRLNLARPPFPMRGPLDAIFCRNVMIYFDRPVREALVAEMTRLLGPGRLLVTGHSEGLHGMGDGLERLVPSVYRRPAPEPAVDPEHAP